MEDKVIPLTPTDLIAVVVDEKATNERIYFEGTLFVETPREKAKIITNVSKIGSCKILGTVTSKGDIDFVAAIVVEGFILHVASQRLVEMGKQDEYVYRNYEDEQVPKSTADESFLSLLRANGIEIKEGEKVLIIQKLN